MLATIEQKTTTFLVFATILTSFFVAFSAPVSAAKKCGQGDNQVRTSIDVGCQAKGSPIMDMLFAFIRFLSVGVGLVIAGSIVFAGIQYTTSRGDPQGVTDAKNRIQSSLLALLLFIFGYAILNYVVPGAFLR